MWVKVFWIAAGGSLGALARYGLGLAVQKWWVTPFPWGTFCVNTLGCLLMGMVWALIEQKALSAMSPVYYFLAVGFLGAFTTLSTFLFQTGMLYRQGQGELAFWNLLGTNAAGCVALMIGFYGADYLARKGG